VLTLKKLAKLNKNFKINSIKTKQSTIVDCFSIFIIYF